MDKLRVGVVGLGGMGRRHIQAIQMGGMEVASICDLSEDAFPAALSICQTQPATYTCWSSLVDREAENLDVLMIATNGPSHAEITQAAAQSRIPYIFCEKPMASSGQQAREMAQICQVTGSRLAVNLSRRYADRYIRLKQELKRGIIGQVHHVNVVIGAGGLGCVGSHYFDLVSWLTDTAATWVRGTIDPNPAPNVRGSQFFDPGGRGMVGYASGMTASFELSGSVPVNSLLQIIGTQGHMEIDEWSSPAGGRIDIFRRPEEHWDELKTRFVRPEPVEFDVGEPLDAVLMTKGCLEDLVGDGREDTVSGGIAAMDTVVAFHLSSQRNWQKVDLLLTGNDLLYYVPIT